MNKKIYIMFAVVCLVLTDAFAQQTLSSLAGNSIKLDNLRVEHTENSLLVKMNLDLDSLEMPSNMRFVFTPMVKYGEKHVLLPQIVLNGRKQDLSYRRWGYKKFSSDVGVPADLKEIVKQEDIAFLSESAFADACRPGNPKDTNVEEIAALYRSLL